MPDSVPTPAPIRRATNVTLREDLVSEAKELRLNVSQACEAGLAAAIRAERQKQWLEENREAFAFWNRYYEENELTLERYRSF